MGQRISFTVADLRSWILSLSWRIRRLSQNTCEGECNAVGNLSQTALQTDLLGGLARDAATIRLAGAKDPPFSSHCSALIPAQ